MVDEKRVTTTPSSEPTDAVRLEFMDPSGQRVWALYANEGSGGAGPPGETGFSLFLSELPSILRRHKWLLLLCILLTCSLGIGYILMAESVYGAEAEVLVERRHSALGDFDRVTVANNAFLATQAEVVHSQAIVEPALATLPFAITDDPEKDPVRIALNTLSVSSVQNTDVLAINYRGPDADQGVALIGAVLDPYKAFVRGVEASGHSEALSLLRDRADALAAELAAKEKEYRESVQRSGSLDSQRGAGEVAHDALTLHAQRAVDAENRRRDLETELRTLKSSLEKDEWFSPGPMADPRLVEMLSEVKSELAVLRVTRGAGHPDALDAQRRISVLKQQIVQQVEGALSRARADERRLAGIYQRESATARSADVERSVQSALQAEIQQLNTSRSQMLAALAEKELTVGALDRAGVQVRVIKAPRINLEKIWPKPGLILAPCIVLGLLGGSVLAIALDRLRPRASVAPAQHVSVARPRRTTEARPSDASLGRALVTRDDGPEPVLEKR